MPKRKAPWPKPSERVRELIRAGAQLALAAPPEWLDEVDAATLSATTKVVAGDPALVAALRRTNRANLIHWATANVRAPGEPVEPNVGDESLSIARDLVRRGITETSLDAYRTGQNAAWLRWMGIAFQLTSDVSELRELLDVSARSISAFIDATIAGISARMAEERGELGRGTHAERREVVSLILEGAPISEHTASRRLGYELAQSHRAAIVWTEERASLAALEAVAEAFARRPLTVIANAGTLWVWGSAKHEPDLARVTGSQVRVAIGSVGSGIDGFRRSHLDALTAQRMIARIGSSASVVRFDEVRLAAFVTQDPEAADPFVRDTLGALAGEPVELRESLRVFLRDGCNASLAAEHLRTHRNTLLRRLSRAEELLPRPLAQQRVEVAVALEILRWRA